MSLASGLADAWARAVAGDAESRSQWCAGEGGDWTWQPSGLLLDGGTSEWSELRWRRCEAATLAALRNFLVEVTVSGTADAAGLSLGPYKDFLVPASLDTGPRRLQLEVDAAAGCWAFRVDGRLIERSWWDGALQTVDDLLDGVLTLKARRAERTWFEDLCVRTFEASCRLSVVIVCYRYLQRLRLALRNWCHQELPSGAYEILVVNPHSPDGTHEHLAATARSYPHVRLRELVVDADRALDKGAMINRAVQASHGEWIWLTDADCLFAPSSARTVLRQLDSGAEHLFYGQRRHLSRRQTDALLSGRVDGLTEFDSLCASHSEQAHDHAPLGYTQIARRSTLRRLPYQDQLDTFASSDLTFVDACLHAGIGLRPVDGLVCLHLHHPFSWFGTDRYL
jgi:Glycosyl transferase family 2